MIFITDRRNSFRLWSTPDSQGQLLSTTTDKSILLVLQAVDGKLDDSTIGCESAPWVFVLTSDGITGWMPFVENHMSIIDC